MNNLRSIPLSDLLTPPSGPEEEREVLQKLRDLNAAKLEDHQQRVIAARQFKNVLIAHARRGRERYVYM